MLAMIQETALIVGSILGAATDIKTGYIYDWVTIPMIIIGIILSIMQLQFTNLILATVIFVSLFLLYKFGKIGGGDVKLFTAIALLNPTNNIYFLFSGIIIACSSAMIFYSTYFTIKYFKKGISISENKRGIQKTLIFSAILIIYFAALIQLNILSAQSALIFLIICFFGLMFMALQEGIKKNFFEKKVKIKDLEEDEVIAEDSNSKRIIEILKGKQLIGENEIKILKKNKIKEIIVLRELPPFGPFIALGVIVATISPNLVMILFI